MYFLLPSQWCQTLNSHHHFTIQRSKFQCLNAHKTCSQASTSAIIHPFPGTAVLHISQTPLPCADVIDTPGNYLPTPPKCELRLSVLQTCRKEEHRPLNTVRWPSASQGTIWWLLPSQLGPHSSSWYKSCQAAPNSRIFKHLGL